MLERKPSFPSTQRLVQIALSDPEPLLYHAEPVLRDGVVVGYVRAASYGWTLGAAVGLAFVGADEPVTKDWLDAGAWSVDIAGDRLRRDGLAAADVRPDQRAGPGLIGSRDWAITAQSVPAVLSMARLRALLRCTRRSHPPS